MFRKAFSGDNIFFRTMNRVGDFMRLNIVFVLSCIPIVTIGAALAGIYSVMYEMSEKKEKNVIYSYFRYFRIRFKQATIYWCGILATGVIICAGFQGITVMNDKLQIIFKVAYILLLIFYIGAFAFGLTLIAWYGESAKETVKDALFITMGSLPWMLFLVVVGISPVLALGLVSVNIMTYILPLLLLFGIPLICYIKTFIYKKVYRKYTNLKNISEVG